MTLGLLIYTDAEDNTNGYWPVTSLTEEEAGWCRYQVGKAAYGLEQTKVTLWRTGTRNFYTVDDNQ